MQLRDGIKTCFRKAGILYGEFQIVAHVSKGDDKEDPFVELDSENSDMEDLENLISQIQDGDSSCLVEEFVSGDSDLPVCQDIFSDKWELDQIAKNPSSELTKETGSSESEEEDEQDVVPRLKSLKEVIHALEEVSFFLDYKGYTDEAYETSKLVNSVAQLHSLKSARQTTIKEYFNWSKTCSWQSVLQTWPPYIIMYTIILWLYCAQVLNTCNHKIIRTCIMCCIQKVYDH